MWTWAETRGIWISAAYVPGKQNVTADYYSRKRNDSKEWSITPNLFSKITHLYGVPCIDLFASRTNHKVDTFVSWYPDPCSVAVDAFSLPWHYNLIYCFPPFSLIGRTLKKIREEGVTAIVVVPLWPTQNWYPTYLSMMIDYPAIFQATTSNLYLPHRPWVSHPLKDKLSLIVAKLSGNCAEVTSFQTQLEASYRHHGGVRHRHGMAMSLRNGRHIVVNGTLTPYTPL